MYICTHTHTHTPARTHARMHVFRGPSIESVNSRSVPSWRYCYETPYSSNGLEPSL